MELSSWKKLWPDIIHIKCGPFIYIHTFFFPHSLFGSKGWLIPWSWNQPTSTILLLLTRKIMAKVFSGLFLAIFLLLSKLNATNFWYFQATCLLVELSGFDCILYSGTNTSNYILNVIPVQLLQLIVKSNICMCLVLKSTL